jgi:hypothetical protein
LYHCPVFAIWIVLNCLVIRQAAAFGLRPGKNCRRICRVVSAGEALHFVKKNLTNMLSRTKMPSTNPLIDVQFIVPMDFGEFARPGAHKSIYDLIIFLLPRAYDIQPACAFEGTGRIDRKHP